MHRNRLMMPGLNREKGLTSRLSARDQRPAFVRQLPDYGVV
jgi:hypothetical protein